MFFVGVPRNLVNGLLKWRMPALIVYDFLTNPKETKRAIQAAVDQYEKYRHHSSIKRKRNRKNRVKNSRAKL